MKRKAAMWLVLGLLTAIPIVMAQEAEKPAENAEKPAEAEQQPDPTQQAEPLAPPFDAQNSQASGLIYIQPGTASQSTSIPMWALLNNPELQQAAVRQAAKQHIKSDPGELKQIVFQYHPSGDNALMTVRSYDDRVRPEWVLDSLRDQVSKELVNLDKPIDQQLMREDARKHMEQMAAEWGAKRRQLADLAKRHHLDADDEVARQRRLQLALDTQRLTVELQGLNARQIVVQRQLGELVARPPDKSSQAILDELSRVVEARKQHVAHLNAQFNTGSITAEKVQPAKAELGQAEVELARFRREAAESSSQRATELRHRLDDTLIESAEVETKLRELMKLDQPLAQIDDLRMEVDLTEHEYRRARQTLDEIEAKLRGYIPPRVVLIRTK